MKNNHAIMELLQDFDLINPDLGKIIRSLRKMVLSVAPNSEEKIMYGGIVYILSKRLFCGLFLRKKHISIEFDLGCLLKDIEKNLEGTGKYRRHLKIHNQNDIETKKPEYYILQSFNLKT